jgi:hypothetical protein
MKKLKILILAALFPVLTFAQGGVEVVPFAGYMFGGSVNYVQGKLNINNGLNYGLSVLVPVQSLIDLELNWTRMEQVRVTFDPYPGYPAYEFEEFDLITNYFQIGAISKFYNGGSSVAQPFGSFSLGATWFEPTKNANSTFENYEDVWRFSIILGLGVKLMFSERVGIMLRGRLMMPMTWGGTGFYFGTGGSGLSFNTWVAPLQGDFNGGLIIKIGGK